MFTEQYKPLKLDKMATTQTSTELAVNEYPSFETAWEAATETRESFSYYQGMEQKIQWIREAQRWFVTKDNRLFYSYLTEDGVRVVREADPYSCLNNADFQYIQIMVSPNLELNPERRGFLRYSGQYVTRKTAIDYTKMGEIYAFNK